jgi:LysM repeat protein
MTVKHLHSVCLFLIFALIPILVNLNQEIMAKEETAHLSLKKTAVSNQNTRNYVVKKGDCIFNIMRDEVGIESRRFSVIKKFNPHLKNLNKILPGQIIILPEKDVNTDDSASKAVYTAKKGDSLIRIAIRQLKVKRGDIEKTVKLIRQLNPGIKDLDRIYPGQVLNLPQGSIEVTKQDTASPHADLYDSSKNEQKEIPIMPPSNRLDAIRHVISRMNGSFMTGGKYFIPIPQMGQVTIDCSIIPVAELDDGSAVLLDIADRVPDTLKKMIQENWKNYHIIKAGSNDDIITILKKIIGASKSYAISKVTKPFTAGNNPPIQFNPDWIISKKAAAEERTYHQGLNFVSDDSQLLSRPMIEHANRNGLIISEIMDGRGLISAPDLKYSAPEIPIINATTTKDLAYAILLSLGYSPVKDAEVKIFDLVRDGFNLSITADLLVKKGARSVLFHLKRIPQQFIENLKLKGTDTAFLEEGASRKYVIEKTIQAMNISYSLDRFLFSEPEKVDKPRVAIIIPAFNIARDKGYLYLIDFDMDRDIYRLLHNKWGVNVIRY